VADAPVGPRPASSRPHAADETAIDATTVRRRNLILAGYGSAALSSSGRVSRWSKGGLFGKGGGERAALERP
jgi:hypothetical protein